MGEAGVVTALDRVLAKRQACPDGGFIEVSQEEYDALREFDRRKVPPLPFSIDAQINEREMRMRCLELGAVVLILPPLPEEYPGQHRSPPTVFETAQRLLHYVLTGTEPPP